MKTSSQKKNFISAESLLEANTLITPTSDKTILLNQNTHIVDEPHDNGLGAINHLILQGNVPVQNCRRKAIHPLHLPFPSMFPPTVSALHLSAFHKACSKGHATIVVMGDSIFATASDMIAHTENATFAWIETLQQQIPHVKFSFINAAAGGRSWQDMNKDTTPPPPWINPPPGMSWKEAVRHFQPDLLLLHSGGNDVGNFNPLSVRQLVSFFQNTPKPPSIILGLTHHPSQASTINNYGTQNYQNNLDGINKWLRTYAQHEGFGYLDFHRWHSMRRDGFDPCELALTCVTPEPDTALPAFGEYVSNTAHNSWDFPSCQNENNISADCCTDFAISFEMEHETAFLSLDLGPRNALGFHAPYSNRFHVFFNDESNCITYTWSDGTNADEARKQVTDIPVPKGPFLFNIMLKGSRLVFSVWHPLSYTNWQPNELTALGTGYQYIYDGSIIRFGGPFTPRLEWAGYNRLRVFNLCVANACIVSNNAARNMPDLTDNDLYQHTYAAGGSGHYHMNAYGVRDILTPVFRAQNWAPSPRRD